MPQNFKIRWVKNGQLFDIEKLALNSPTNGQLVTYSNKKPEGFMHSCQISHTSHFTQNLMRIA